MKVTWAPAALRDLRNNYLYLCAQHSPINAWAQYVRFFEFGEELGKMPRAGRARDDLQPGLRTRPFETMKFVFRVSNDELRILRVLHHSRDHERILGRR